MKCPAGAGLHILPETRPLQRQAVPACQFAIARLIKSFNFEGSTILLPRNFSLAPEPHADSRKTNSQQCDGGRFRHSRG
jgi:hypothetical protein